MGVDNVTSGSSTSGVPATDAGEAPETGQEGVTPEVPADESVPAEAAPPAEGEVPAEEPPTSGESTAWESYSTSEPPTSTNTASSDTGLPGAEEGQTVDDWFTQQLEAANKGDPEALKNLQTFMEAPVQDSDTLADQLKSQDQFADEEGEADQKKIYDEALYQRDLNAMLAKTTREKALQLPKDSPIRQDLLKKSDQLAAANKKLDGQIKSYEARRQDTKSADAKKQLDRMTGAKVQDLPEEQLAALKARFGSNVEYAVKDGKLFVKNEQGKFVSAQKAAKQAEKKELKETQEATRKEFKEGIKTAKDKAKETAEAKKASEAPGATDADVIKAQETVAQQVDPKLREERLRLYQERQAKVKAAREAFRQAKAEIKQGTGEYAFLHGARTLVGSKEGVGEREYRDTHAAGFADVVSGNATNPSVTGIVNFDGSIAQAAEDGALGIEGRHTVAAFSGKREDVEKGMAALLQARSEFRSSLAQEKSGFIYGFGFQNWIPSGEREDKYAGELRMRDLGVA